MSFSVVKKLSLALLVSTAFGTGAQAASIAANADTGASNLLDVAHAIESLGAGNDVYNATAMQAAGASTQMALNQFTGQIHPNVKAGLLEGQMAFGQMLSDHLAQTSLPAQRGQIGSDAAQIPALEPTREDKLIYGDKVARASTQKLDALAPQAWLQGFGDWSSRDGDGNANRQKQERAGAVLGLDAAVGDGWRTGLAFSFQHTNEDKDNATGAEGDAGTYSLGLYGGKSFSNKLAVRGGASYGYSEINTRRTIAFPGYQDYLKATYYAHNLQAFGEVAYDFDIKATRLEPFWNMTVGYVSVPDFSEKGGASALHGHSSEETQGISTLGLRVRQNLPWFGKTHDVASVNGMLGWRHLIGDSNPETTLTFLQGGQSFTEDPAKMARDAVAVGVGFDFALGNQTTLGLAYNGAYSAKTDDQAVRGSVAYRF